ncbi:MAG: sporulation protein YqfC [Firmicutes bacterium]|nr:sporulation protein YqfC [Bacillota bacterium]
MVPRTRLGRRLADLLDLPPEVVLALPKLTLVGDARLTLENHRGLIEYGPQRIRVSTDRGEIAIEGAALTIESILKEEILLTGRIHAIRFIDWEDV